MHSKAVQRSGKLVLHAGLPELLAAGLRRGGMEPCPVELEPHLGIEVRTAPGLQYGSQTKAAPPVGFTSRLVRVEEGTAEGGDGVDGAPALGREEEAGPVRPSGRHQRGDAEGLAPLQDQ